jgi:hypothetical protein
LAHLRSGAAVKRPAGELPRISVMRTPAAMLRRLGRWVLWAFVLVLLLRGAADLFERERPPVPVRAAPAAAAWPDDDARAFAVDFARAYLTYSPQHPDVQVRTLQAFATPDLAASIAPELDDDARRQVVDVAAVARTARIDAGHALVTVAATVSDGSTVTRYLTVPVARDARGGLVVSELPSFTAPPARAEVVPPAVETLTGPDRAAIEDVLQRFFTAYLAGETDDLEYLVPAGVRLGALGQPHKLLGVTAIAAAGPPQGRTRAVLATVRAQDVRTKAVFSLRYRLRLVRQDRWYVLAVNTTTKGG